MSEVTCWYESVCSQLSETCQYSCIRFREMRYLMEHSNIPPAQQTLTELIPEKVDYPAFCDLADFKDNILHNVEAGRNLYIYSDSTGNGKTTWAIKIMLKFFDCVWAGNGFKCRGVFIHVPTFLASLKNFSISDPKFDELKQNILDVDLVIWDDIGSVGLSQFDHSQLLSYIDTRVLNKRSNIFTGNIGESKIEECLGTRLASRVWNASTKIELKGKDKRGW